MDIFNLVGRIGIDGIGNVQSQLNGVINQAQNAGKTIGTAFQNIGTAMTSMGTKLTGALTAPIAGITLLGIKYNATMQSLQTDFKVMLGSQEKALAMTKKLVEMGASTPFESGDLAQATKILLSFGYTGQQVIPIMSRLGDVALGDNTKFQSLTRTMGQINALGKLQGGDLNQLIGQGWNPLNEIIKKTGETTDQLRDRMEKGNVTYKEVEDALVSVTSKGGAFYKGMAEGSKTFNGQLSTLIDTWNMFIGELTKPIFNELMKILPKVIEFLGEISDKFKSLDNDTKTVILVIGGLVAGIGPLLVVFGTLIGFCGFVVTGISGIVAGFGTFVTVLGAILSPIGIAVTAIVGLAVGIGGLLLTSSNVRQGITDAFNGIVEKIRSATEWVKLHLTDIQNAFIGFFTFISTGNYDQSFEKLRNALYNMFPDHKKKIDDLLFQLGQIVAKAGEVTTWIETVGIPTLNRWWDEFVKIAKQIKADFNPTFNACKGLLVELGGTVSSVAGLIRQLSKDSNAGKTSMDNFANAGKNSKSSMKELASALTTIVKGLSTVVGWFNTAINAISSADKWCKNFSKSASEAINKIPLLGGLYKKADKLLGFASGTDYAPGGLAIVGENGPELVNLNRGSKVYTAQETKSMLSNSTPTGINSGEGNFVINGNIVIDASNIKDLNDVLNIFRNLKSERIARGGAY